jgi:hypothetical protein
VKGTDEGTTNTWGEVVSTMGIQVIKRENVLAGPLKGYRDRGYHIKPTTINDNGSTRMTYSVGSKSQ